ncbi:TPA: hypothetical protein L4R63_005781 [Pseudomonas aeruginosa]|nr:hypothetical protein [Pseudomonas aeruginosa]
MTKANECTCPSGDGSLRWPCPVHPPTNTEAQPGTGFFDRLVGAPRASVSDPDLLPLDEHLTQVSAMGKAISESVEQAGGDERAAFRPAQVISYRPGMGEVTIYVAGRVPGYMNIGDTVYVSDRAPVEQPSAALAQPSPTLPPFAEKVLTKLRRFNECAEDPGSGGVDIGRHWLDLLTQLGLLNRVQRSPALWEISQQGEDLLGTPQPSPAQAEAERPELLAVHAQGPDELYAAFNRADAEKHAAELNCLPVPVSVSAVVIPSPWPPAEHWQYLAEQERDHKNEIAGRLRQFERICEGLPQGAIDGGWTAQGIRGYAKRLEDQLKAALARVAELEKLSRAHDPLRIGLSAMLGSFKTATNPEQEGTLRMARQLLDATADARYGDFKNKAIVDRLIAGLRTPVAQAQHSVPDGASDLCRFLAKLYCELDGLRYSTAKLPAEQIADALIFKWPVLQGARNQLNIKRISEQPYDESKLHSAIAAMLAAAPAQGGE